MLFTRKRHPLLARLFLSSDLIVTVDQMRDLGVLFLPNLNFDLHIDHIVSKSMLMLGFIKRICYNFTNVDCLKSIYFAHVRSHLEFACVVWSPDYQNHALRIESVQKQFVLFVLRRSFNRHTLPSYQIRCGLLKIQPLIIRRNTTSSMFVFDLISSRISSPYILGQLSFHVPSRQLRQHFVLNIPFRRTNYAQNEPVYRLSRIFNAVSHLFDYNITRNHFKYLLTHSELHLG